MTLFDTIKQAIQSAISREDITGKDIATETLSDIKRDGIDMFTVTCKRYDERNSELNTSFSIHFTMEDANTYAKQEAESLCEKNPKLDLVQLSPTSVLVVNDDDNMETRYRFLTEKYVIPGK